MTFKDYEDMTKEFADEDFPLAGKNENGENLFIFKGESDGERFFKVTTFQHNGWTRTNRYYENGNSEEWFEMR